jgi:hypothetical protein
MAPKGRRTPQHNNQAQQTATDNFGLPCQDRDQSNDGSQLDAEQQHHREGVFSIVSGNAERHNFGQCHHKGGQTGESSNGPGPQLPPQPYNEREPRHAGERCGGDAQLGRPQRQLGDVLVHPPKTRVHTRLDGGIKFSYSA